MQRQYSQEKIEPVDESWKEQMDSSTSPQDSCDDAKLTDELEAIRCEGNELFSVQNWIGAVDKYSQCINKAISEFGTHIGIQSTSSKLNIVVRLAYSNRAEASLRLEAFEDALNDADKALEFDPKHVKSLVRKGWAAHSLGLFEKSLISFKAALDQAPQEELSILHNLIEASTIAYEQSRTGNYDLSDFFVRDCTGNVPRCADFVGPVEIRHVHNGGHGGRGLFATKKVESGQILLVSNPFAILRQKSDVSKMDFDFKMDQTKLPVVNSGIPQDFIGKLATRIMKSKRQMAQLYSLASHGKQEMEIPSMELFRPGSEWVPPCAEKLEVDMGLIKDIAKINAFGYGTKSLLERIRINQIGKVDMNSPGDVPRGIWLLPSFANHSCVPNCLPAFIGDTMFLRAAMDIVEGEELTIPYFGAALFESLGIRQAVYRTWFFTCKCERCLLEESLKPQLDNIGDDMAIPRLSGAATIERQGGLKKGQATKALAKVADRVEGVIQSLDAKLKPQQQSWVRASFGPAYCARVSLAMDEHDLEALMGSIRLVVDSLAAVCVDSSVLTMAAGLLLLVEQKYSKNSQAYQLTLDRVLGIYTVAFGKQPISVMHKLIKARLQQE